MAKDVACSVSRTCRLHVGTQCYMSGIPTRGLEGWGVCGHPGAQAELWGAAEMWRKKTTGFITEVKHSVVTTKCLLKRWILGDIWLAEARETETCPGDPNPPVLPSRDMGRAGRIRCSPSPAQDIWGDGLPARLPAGHSSPIQWEVATQQHMRAVKSSPVLGQAALKPRVSPNLKA